MSNPTDKSSFRAVLYTDQLFSILNNFPGIVYLQAKDYSIRFANKRFIEQYGEPRDKTCYSAIWNRTEPCTECPTFKVFETGEPVVWRSTHTNGHTYKVYDSPFTAHDGEELVLEMSIDTTEQHKAELELDKAKEIYKGIFQNSQVGLARTSLADGTFIELNNRFAKMFGYSTPEEFMKERTAIECYADLDDREKLKGLLLKGSAVENYKAKALHKDGSTFWIQFSAQIDSKNEHIDIVIVNIDAETRAQEELKEAKETYQEMLQNSMVGLSRTRVSDGKFIEINDRLVSMLGYSDREDFVLRYNSVQFYAISGERERFLNILKEHGRVENFLTLVKRKDNSTFWIQLSAHIDVEKGYIDVVSLDVDKEKRADAEIRASEQKYRTLFEESNDIIFITTPEGTVLDINPAGLKLFGYTKEEFSKLDLATDLYSVPEQREVLKKILYNKGWVKNFETEFKVKDGSLRTGILSINVLRDSTGNINGFRGILHDITERKALQLQLQHSQKMEAIGRLAGGIAHDFNNIITVTKTLSDLAIKKVGDKEELLKYLKPISESSGRAATLVHQLLLFSRNKPPKTLKIDINKTVTELISMLNYLISEDITINTELSTVPLIIDGDTARLDQLIINLVVNASEAMPDGGEINIKTSHIAGTDKKCCSHPMDLPVTEQYACLEITDHGTGIDKNIIDQIFEPFFTTSKAKGTGMGLAVVYGIVNELKGCIDVANIHSGGCRFKICIPSSTPLKEVESQKPVPPVPPVVPAGNGKRILLVEDDKWVRKSTALLLRDAGYEVFEARNAEKALGLFYHEKGAFDLVISDVVMPGRSGIELLNPLLDINPSVPILLCSGRIDNKEQFDDIISRRIPYIQKPYENYDLLLAISEIIEEKPQNTS